MRNAAVRLQAGASLPMVVDGPPSVCGEDSKDGKRGPRLWRR
jgi:hypothetical protein